MRWNGARSLAFSVLALWCQFAHGEQKALLTVEHPDGSLRRKSRLPGLYAEWSDLRVTVRSSSLIHPRDNPDGCRPHRRRCRGCALLVFQGNCTFALKARHAEAAGYNVLVVVSTSDRQVITMGAAMVKPSRLSFSSATSPHIPAIMVPNSLGRKLLPVLARGVRASISVEPNSRFWDDLLGEAMIGLAAVSLVVAGAYYSCEDMRYPQTAVRDADVEEVQAVEAASGLHFLLHGSLLLTLLFFFMRYGIYLLIFCFVLGAISSTVSVIEPIIASRCPALRDQKAYRLPNVVSNLTGIATDHSMSDVLAETFAFALAAGFVINRNNDAIGWIFQDISSVALLLMIQRSIRFPNLKVATIFLVCTFFFDIFWVFISPTIFGKSVMIEVATGGGTGQSVPLVLKIPDAYGRFKILGFGDIAIPGMMISLLLRHDLAKKVAPCSGYFLAGVIGYTLGLLATFISLYLMKHGQPALLFLVPGMLVPTFLIALRKGEVAEFWQASYRPPATAAEAEGYQQLPDAPGQA